MSEALCHYGIKGMKWGVRRYQNKDGTLTPAGKRRAASHPDYESAHDRKDPRTLSDKELRARINRIQMEKQYADLTKKKSRISNGKKWVARIVMTSVTAAAAPFVKRYANAGIRFLEDMYINPAASHFDEKILDLVAKVARGEFKKR